MLVLVLYTILTTHIGILLTSIYLHRYVIHRQYILNPVVEHVFRFVLWITDGVLTKPFTAQHRKHHKYTDCQGDPHSPVLVGNWRVLGYCLVPNFFSEYKYFDTDWALEHYGAGTPDDWMERHIYCHTKMGLLILLAIDVSLFGGWGIVSWLVHMFCVSLFVNATITGFGHWFGYCNYLRQDCSTNVIPWGILGSGEELHHNHHKDSRQCNFAINRNEFDLGYAYIQLMVLLRLAKCKR
jgi:stearoyl-CoA desaturase (delta-9 desaturase)